MYDLRLIGLLQRPSLFSGTLTILLSIIVIGYYGWSYAIEGQLFYEYIFGYGGLDAYLWHSQSLSIWQRTFLNSPLTYYALVLVIAAIAGLIVYSFLHLASFARHSLKEGWDSLHSKGKTARSLATELVFRLSLRIIGLVCWAFYAAFFTSIALPFNLALNRVGINYINDHNPIGWLICFGTLVIFMVLVHLHVIFLRLVFLRPRIFGGKLALEFAQIQDSNHNA